MGERLATLEPNGDLGRVACGDLLEQLSDIWLRNPARFELGRLDVAVKDRDRLR